MKKIILLFCVFYLTNLTFIFAAESPSETATEVIKGFKDKKYSEVYNYFYTPPYYGKQDIQDDKECFMQALKNFHEVLGELEKYNEIPLSEQKNEWLTISGAGESGSYYGPFALEEGKPFYLNVYKADFSKLKGINLYVFIVKWKGKFKATQFGVTVLDAAKPPDDEEGGPMQAVAELDFLNKAFFYEKFPDRKAKVFADRIIYSRENFPQEAGSGLHT